MCKNRTPILHSSGNFKKIQTRWIYYVYLHPYKLEAPHMTFQTLLSLIILPNHLTTYYSTMAHYQIVPELVLSRFFIWLVLPKFYFRIHYVDLKFWILHLQFQTTLVLILVFNFSFALLSILGKVTNH